MKIERIACDSEPCNREDAQNFQVFAYRKPDGAGSMENWYDSFDLCPHCAAAFLRHVLTNMKREDVLAHLNTMLIKTRTV